MPNNLSISSSKIESFVVNDVVRFLLKLALISLPFFLIFTFALFVLGYSGELSCVDQIVHEQQKGHSILVGMAYSNPEVPLKLKQLEMQKNTIIVLGTSRSLEFRSEFFKRGSFYNAGRAIAKIEHLPFFLKHLAKGQEPKIIILGLDQNFFNENWIHRYERDVESMSKNKYGFDVFKNNWASMYKDYFKKKFLIRQFFQKKDGVKRIGLNAIINNNGFRGDGSYRYGKQINNPNDATEPDYQFKQTLGWVAKGSDRFTYGDDISQTSIRQLREFLVECKERKIEVVGFFPPYAHAVYEKMKCSGKHNYIFKLDAAVKPVFADEQFDFFDFSDMANLGAADAEAINGFHASEKAYLRAFIQMLQTGSSSLNQFADMEYLKSQLAASKNNLEVFPN